jgi:recombination endonuclease VII
MQMSSQKSCKKCGQVNAEFYKWNGSTCKKCYCLAHKKYVTPERLEAVRKYKKDTYDPVKQAIQYRRQVYGITEEQYQRMIQEQNGVCFLCLETRPLCIDHDHNQCGHAGRNACAGCIRGLLCDQCNRRHLPWAEKHERWQSEVVKDYLKRRPLCK